ncbi:MAG: hypothetical protein BRC59_01060, partial [Cyanobacteria bacterium SW_4_48_29]
SDRILNLYLMSLRTAMLTVSHKKQNGMKWLFELPINRAYVTFASSWTHKALVCSSAVWLVKYFSCLSSKSKPIAP